MYKKVCFDYKRVGRHFTSETMKNLRILLLILTIGLNSCSDKKSKSEIEKTKTKKQIDKEKYDRFWITYKYPDSTSKKMEVYVSKEKDTIINQFKFYNRGIIDSTKSRFYEFEIVKSEKVDTYNGILNFYSENDSNPKNVDSVKTLSLSVFQKSRDSSYYQKFESKSGNKINFELVNYENDQLVGILKELRFIQKDVKGKDMLEVIETTMAVDNKPKTHNIGIEIYNLPKKRSANRLGEIANLW